MASKSRTESSRCSKKLRDELVCGICRDLLNQPKTLTQCSHSFCLTCLERQFTLDRASPTSRLQSNELCCPLCREVTTISQGGVTDLPTVHTLQSVAEIVAEESEENNGRDAPPRCQQHHVILNQYCATCNELVCSECIHDPKHRDHFHSVHLAHKALPDYLKSLSVKLQLANQVVSEMERLQNEVEEKRGKISSNGKEVKDEIDACFTEMTMHLEKRREALTSAVQLSIDAKLATLDEHIGKLQSMKTAAACTVSAVATLLQSTDIHTLTIGKRVEGELEDRQKSVDSLHSQLQNEDFGLFLRFQEESSLEQHIRTLGTLSVYESGPQSSRTLKHDLRVEKDGKIYEVLPASHRPRYIPVVPVPAVETSAHSTYVVRTPSPVDPPLASESFRSPYYENVRRTTAHATLHPVVRLDDNSSKSSANHESIYDEIPGTRPPLPPENSSRNRTHRYAPPRHEAANPEIIQPVQVVNNDHLRDPSTNEKVYPTGIYCTSSFDNITITDTHNHCLRQIDQHGEFSQTIGSQGKTTGQFDTPTAVALGAENDNYWYVVDQTNSRVQKLTIHGESVSTFGRKHLLRPEGIAVSESSGNVYVSDSQKRRVYVYRSDCTYERPIGKNDKDIQFDHPVGVAFDTAGNLLVVDCGRNACIWHISQPEGKLIQKIGQGYLHIPCDVVAGIDGSIVVTERGVMNCVFIFSPNGKVIRCFGKTGSKPGEFNGPSGIAVNSQGQIIVADQHNQRLQIFDLSNGAEKAAKTLTPKKVPESV